MTNTTASAIPPTNKTTETISTLPHRYVVFTKPTITYANAKRCSAYAPFPQCSSGRETGLALQPEASLKAPMRGADYGVIR